MNTIKIILGVIVMFVLLMAPHLLVIAIWYPIGLIVYGVYKGMKNENTKGAK